MNLWCHFVFDPRINFVFASELESNEAVHFRIVLAVFASLRMNVPDHSMSERENVCGNKQQSDKVRATIPG